MKGREHHLGLAISCWWGRHSWFLGWGICGKSTVFPLSCVVGGLDKGSDVIQEELLQKV